MDHPTLERIRKSRAIQTPLGLVLGILFGFLVERAGVVRYEIIIGQLLLTDFTVVKMMLSAVIVGGIGFFLLRRAGLAATHTVRGSIGATVAGGLIFGVGFGLLGYCPGTLAGAAGTGALDALFGGFAGLLLGSAVFAALYPVLDRKILHTGEFPLLRLTDMLGWGEGTVVFLFVAACTGFLFLLEAAGL
ncbi:MAG TPA: YeeE/YedE thiosulfate transporter family protein [Methanoregulaceae archaeon]|nr:YeeE/YedE thiosulfate transporter family protein [Methanoregulaceae archaeon]HPD74847.1 YeeE/YedE thiosulfate transporter family protein [Methanoregulaceae archaeon]HRY75826.1 YeeE/YedE thiosulfate transporter family protein [Methanoregulaceae archaeon]